MCKVTLRISFVRKKYLFLSYLDFCTYYASDYIVCDLIKCCLWCERTQSANDRIIHLPKFSFLQIMFADDLLRMDEWWTRTAWFQLLHFIHIDQWPNDALIHLNLLTSTTRKYDRNSVLAVGMNAANLLCTQQSSSSTDKMMIVTIKKHIFIDDTYLFSLTLNRWWWRTKSISSSNDSRWAVKPTEFNNFVQWKCETKSIFIFMRKVRPRVFVRFRFSYYF